MVEDGKWVVWGVLVSLVVVVVVVVEEGGVGADDFKGWVVVCVVDGIVDMDPQTDRSAVGYIQSRSVGALRSDWYRIQKTV
ncbi:hypothetical protein M501DRAFT_995097 [Patellaria atrata CBS 101060]|uniref:Uncharacterized protein n=1 Tax=Patellaria atrata CBS 101060 TaxID=1346257 RepID=A0A9P4VQ12_9PEZI|nr:hypothetical protein M501DRAFT_995097 [Patellaria atrata CBS 101060]